MFVCQRDAGANTDEERQQMQEVETIFGQCFLCDRGSVMNSFKGWSDSHWGHGECVPARQPGDAEPGGQHHPSHRLRPLWHSQWLHWAGHPVASGNFVRGHIFFMHPYGFISYFSFTCAFLLQEFYELLLELQKRLTKAIKSVGRIEHSVWRSFQRYFFKDIHYTL